MPASMTNKANIIPFGLASAVAPAGTVTVGYPTGYGKGNYVNSNNQHALQIGQNIYHAPNDVGVAFGANSVTLTNNSTQTWPQGATAYLQLNLSGAPITPLNHPPVPLPLGTNRVYRENVVALDLGSPIAGAANNIALSQAVAGVGNLTFNGSIPVSGVAVADVPRTLQVKSSNSGDTTQTVTFTGKDEYGQKVTETVTLNGTSAVVSKKALASVSNAAVSAALTGNATLGFSNTLGLALAVYTATQLLTEQQDGTAPTAGTLTLADKTKPAATTGDVRGTYAPNATPNGNIGFSLRVAVPDVSDNGVANYGV